MLKGVNENCSSVSFSEFFGVGVEKKRPCLTDQLILNRFPVLRKKKMQSRLKFKRECKKCLSERISQNGTLKLCYTQWMNLKELLISKR